MALFDLLLVTGTFAGIYALLAIGLNLHWGDTGLLNFAHAAFFGVGAYTSAILTTPVGLAGIRSVGFDLPIPVGIVAGTVAAGVVGVLIGLTSFRLEDDYLAIVTLGFAQLILLVFETEKWLTGGVRSVVGIERPLESTLPGNYNLWYLLLVLVSVAAAYVVFRRITESSFGRGLHAVREDENVPEALGKDVRVFKLKSFGLGAAVAGFAGGLWAHYIFSLSPSMFDPTLTFFIWSAVIIGGYGSYRGAIAGVVFITLVQQATRFLPSGMPFADLIPHFRLIIIGALTIGVLYFRPQGLFGDREQMEAAMEGA